MTDTHDQEVQSTSYKDQEHYHQDDAAVSELPSEAPESAPNMDPVELYGSWSQYEQYQTTTAVVQTDQTFTDSGTGYYAYPTYDAQQSQVTETQASVSVTQYSTFSTEQTYDTAQTMVYAVPQAVTTHENAPSVSAYASVQSQQSTETAYHVPTTMDSQAAISQVMIGQPAYSTQTVSQYQSDGLPTTTAQTGQAPMSAQPQFQVQGGIQTTASYQIQTAPDGQQYYVQAQGTGPQTMMYQIAPGNIPYITTPSGPVIIQIQNSQPSKPKLFRRETASQAKEATINFSKTAWGKSKEFIVNKDGARAVAKQAWKQSKDLTIKTSDMLDKYVKPLMPFIAATDPELAASLRLMQGAGHGLKGPQARKPVGGRQPQMDAAALANLAQVLALLQQTQMGAGGVNGNGSGQVDDGQARLLAALLQVQQQQQPQQQQTAGPQYQQQQQQQQQMVPPQKQQQQIVQPQIQQHQMAQPRMQQQQQQTSYPQVQQEQQQTGQSQMQKAQPAQGQQQYHHMGQPQIHHQQQQMGLPQNQHQQQPFQPQIQQQQTIQQQQEKVQLQQTHQTQPQQYRPPVQQSWIQQPQAMGVYAQQQASFEHGQYSHAQQPSQIFNSQHQVDQFVQTEPPLIHQQEVHQPQSSSPQAQYSHPQPLQQPPVQQQQQTFSQNKPQRKPISSSPVPPGAGNTEPQDTLIQPQPGTSPPAFTPDSYQNTQVDALGSGLATLNLYSQTQPTPQ